MHRPEHACALLTDHRGLLVLQVRPAWSTHAAGQLVCFGGKCEPDETVAACLVRELHEEIGWAPAEVPVVGVDLLQGPRFIARFLPLRLPAEVVIRTEPGFAALRADRRTLPGLPLSPWHRAVIAAWIRGERSVELPTAG